VSQYLPLGSPVFAATVYRWLASKSRSAYGHSELNPMDNARVLIWTPVLERIGSDRREAS
jgi:hypothetical protein